jgi:hypothetical protein
VKRFALFAVLCLVLPSTAAAVTPEQRIAKLERQVRQLQRQVKVLENVAGIQLSYSACVAATTADAFRGTWRAIDEVAGRALIGPQPAVNDYEGCSKWEIPRNPEATPASSIFATLLDVFR